MPRTKSKGSSSRVRTRNGIITRRAQFEYVNTGGYYHSLPGDPLRTFIDTTAEVQRAMGFQNEKDHPEVAPSQFEINYGYGEVVARRRSDSALQADLPRRSRPTWDSPLPFCPSRSWA